MTNRSLLVAIAATMVGVTARAQSVRSADSLLQSGSLVRAESIYYAAARARPHDPIARWALGRYLVARGASRVGATLFEEALHFGGEPAIVGRDLVPVYLTIGDYRSLAALTAATPAERERAQWLVAHETRIIAPDSALAAVFRPSTDSTIVGHVLLRINGRTVDAAVTARAQGIVISDTTLVARGLHRFSGGEREPRPVVLGAADSIGIGRLSMTNYPVSIARVDNESATIGLDVLGRFASTFDAKTGRITLHSGGVAPADAAATRLLTLTTASDVRIMQSGGWISVTRNQVSRMLRDHRWSFDAKRGQIVIDL